MRKELEMINTEGILTKYLDAFSRRDIDGIMALCAPSILHLHPFPQPVKGLEAVRKENEAFFRAFPDLQVELGSLITKGEWGAAEFILKGTHKGPLEAPIETIPPTNRSVEMRCAGFWRLDDEGRVVEERYYFDTASLMKQLGVKAGS